MRAFDAQNEIVSTAAFTAVAPASTLVLNPDAYMAAWLGFQDLLPDHLSPDLPEAVYNAVAFHLANPEPVASYEYMQAFVNLMNAHQPVHNLSLAALGHMAPEVAAYALAQLIGQPEQPHF